LVGRLGACQSKSLGRHLTAPPANCPAILVSTGYTIQLAVRDVTKIAASWRAVADLTRQLPFDVVGHGRLAILVTEMATNVLNLTRCGWTPSETPPSRELGNWPTGMFERP